MDISKTEKLMAICPDFFKSDTQYAVTLWGFECGNGWENLLRDMLLAFREEMKSWSKKDIDNFVCTQIKEKFGGLRVYYTGGSSSIEHIIEKAEDRALTTCEMCGKPGALYSRNRWLLTRCESCKESGDKLYSDTTLEE